MRAAAGEQVRSLGAKFLEVDLGGIQTEDKGGYAVELSPEALQRGRDLIAEQAKNADVIITTAQVPGRRAPVLMDEAAVNGMKRGSVVIDLAGATGGNVTLSQPDEIVERDGVTIIAPDESSGNSSGARKPTLFAQRDGVSDSADQRRRVARRYGRQHRRPVVRDP